MTTSGPRAIVADLEAAGYITRTRCAGGMARRIHRAGWQRATGWPGKARRGSG